MGNTESDEKSSFSVAQNVRSSRRTLNGSGNTRGGRHGWYTKHDMKRLLMILRAGDLIEIERNYYAHWAVCVAVGTEGAIVIHFTIDDGIQSDKLIDILADDECRVNNAKDGDNVYVVNSPEEIVGRAKFYLEHPEAFGEYSTASNNCEHFATGCRYNRKKSKQVETVVETSIAAAIGVVAVAAAIGMGIKAYKNRDDDNKY